MEKIYASLVHAGKWALEDVPELWRAEVTELLGAEPSQHNHAVSDVTSEGGRPITDE